MGRFCGDCGAAVAEDATFCGDCGAPSPPVSQEAYSRSLADEAASLLGADIAATTASLGALGHPAVHAGYPVLPGSRPTGKPRPVGLLILLFIVTLGIYSHFWTYVVHEELRAYTRRGMGGLVALLLWFFLAPVVAFTLPYQVEQAYPLSRQRSPVRALTGLWILLPLVGGIVWFVKVQRALNRYWHDELPTRSPARPPSTTPLPRLEG